MSSDSAENNPPKEKSFELDLSSLGFGPSWVSGPSEKVSSGNGGPRRDGDRPRFRDGPGGDRRVPAALALLGHLPQRGVLLLLDEVDHL